MKPSRQLPRLERLVLDADVNARVLRYLSAIGFDVVLASGTGINVRDDTGIVRWARRNRRILVAHDRWKDRKTKFKVFNEIHRNGGKAIQVRGGPQQHELSTVGKIIANRQKWLLFFKDNDGICEVSEQGCKSRSREYIVRQIRGVLRGFESQLPPKVTRRSRRRPISRPSPIEQQRLPLDQSVSIT